MRRSSRPELDTVRKQVSVKLSHEQYLFILRYAKDNGLSGASEVIRHAVWKLGNERDVNEREA